MNKYSKIILTAAIMVLVATGLAAWSITDTYFGNKQGGYEVRSFSMGAAGTFNDLRPFGIAANPANLTLLDKKLAFQGGALITRNEDNRHIPLYNSFDNYIDDAVYASNINFYDDYAIAGMGALQFGMFKMGLGIYRKPLLDFGGYYHEEIRNNRNTDNDGYPEKLAINKIENTGNLMQNAGVLSFGFDLSDCAQMNFGAELSLLQGKQEYSKTIRWSQWAIDTFADAVNNASKVLPNYEVSSDTELEGMQLKAGTAIRFNKRFGMAATYTPKATLDRTGNIKEHRDAYYNADAIDNTLAIDEDYILPAEIRLGILYQPQNIMRTWFNLDAEYVQWSQISSHYEDQFNLYAGVEHWVENRFPLRLGFQAQNGYLREVETDGSVIAKRILTPMLTAGSSFQLTSFLTIDLGFGYSWREYEAIDLFGDAYYNDRIYSGSSTYALWPNSHITLINRGWENPDKVRENNISLNTGITFTW